MSHLFNNKPLISVIIPVYNCEKTVETAIGSILGQTYSNIEVIAVNDGSTDGSLEILEKVASMDNRVKIVNQEPDPERFDSKLNRNVNAGYSARNAGLKIARGDLITFQDADDASFLNRLEIQYALLEQFNSVHMTLDWVRFDEKLLNKKIDIETFTNRSMLGPRELYDMSQRSKGFVAKISSDINRRIPFHIKRKRFINKFFFGSLENYPGQGNCPLFRREVIGKVAFRSLRYRIWPSFMGRGADKDFNFQVAETFRNSHVIFLPAYMWRVKDENSRYEEGLPRLFRL